MDSGRGTTVSMFSSVHPDAKSTSNSSDVGQQFSQNHQPRIGKLPPRNSSSPVLSQSGTRQSLNSSGKEQSPPELSRELNSPVIRGSRIQQYPLMNALASKSNQRRVTPILPRRFDKSRELVEFATGAEEINGSSSSSSLQMPIRSNSSGDETSLSNSWQNLPAQRFASPDLEVDNDSCSVSSLPVRMVQQRGHCSSETNFGATLPQAYRHDNAVTMDAKLSASENAQQLRRRSRSADNLSRQNSQHMQDVWSTVEIDINGSGAARPPSGKPESRGQSNQKGVECLPPAFDAVRLRPFRQQMNSVVVGCRFFHLWYLVSLST